VDWRHNGEQRALDKEGEAGDRGRKPRYQPLTAANCVVVVEKASKLLSMMLVQGQADVRRGSVRLLQAAGLGQLNVADQSKKESLFAIAQGTCDCKQGNGMNLAGGTGLSRCRACGVATAELKQTNQLARPDSSGCHPIPHELSPPIRARSIQEHSCSLARHHKLLAPASLPEFFASRSS
jgi:hypothetical protein